MQIRFDLRGRRSKKGKKKKKGRKRQADLQSRGEIGFISVTFCGVSFLRHAHELKHILYSTLPKRRLFSQVHQDEMFMETDTDGTRVHQEIALDSLF